METTMKSPTHRAMLNGAVREFHASEYDELAPWVAANGGGVPRIETIAQPGPSESVVVAVPEVVRGRTVDSEGALRSEIDRSGAMAAGFAPAQPYYRRGTMVLDAGVERARELRLAFDDMPDVDEAVADLIERVNDEHRRDEPNVVANLRMYGDGDLRAESGERLVINERAFPQFCARTLGGGGDYLRRCWPELRARNVNQWMSRFAEEEKAKREADGAEFQPNRVVLRTRDCEGASTREVFATVSENYTPFDVDKIAASVDLAMPQGAKMRVVYDGFKARIDVLFHSTVQPEKYVAGEFFRAGLTIRTDDTAGGSVVGHAFVEQNLCLNLVLIDRAAIPLFSLRHIGSVSRLADDFRAGLRRAEESLRHFIVQWGYAQRDDLVAMAERAGEFGDERPVTLTEMFAGFARGAVKRELVPLPMRRGETVAQLRHMFEQDVSGDGPRAGLVTRAGLVNAFTRYAHSVEPDPFKAHEIEQAASALLWPARKGAALPHIPFVGGSGL